MIYNDLMTFIEYIKEKRLYLWGCGEYCNRVTAFLKVYGIDNYSFIDNSIEKQKKGFLTPKVYSPEFILNNSDSKFIIISCSYFKEISDILTAHGLKHFNDFVDGINLENEICLLKYKDIESAKPLTPEEMLLIEQKLADEGLKIKSIKYSEDDLKILENKMEFAAFYNKDTNLFYKRKLCEYLLNYSLLGLNKYSSNDIYVDVGASSTSAVMLLREKYGINAYGVDLCKSPLNKSYYLQEDATKTSFDDNSVTGISLQSTFCLFLNNADIEFIYELKRILKDGGKAVISPLYLYKEYISLVSPQHYNKGYNDIGSKEYIRRDWPNIYMSRYYSPEKIKERIIDTANKLGMKTTIFVLDNSQVPYYEFAYLKFVLLIEK